MVDLDYIKSSLMVFYKGSVSYTDFESMPIDKILQLNDMANRIQNEINKAAK